MNNGISQIADTFFDEIDLLYRGARDISDLKDGEHIFRGRQHSVSSKIEDLMALLIYRFLRHEYPNIPFCCMVDFRMDINGAIMFPDIAIIIEKENPVLVSYIDLKTDLGYKRDYHLQFNHIKEKILLLRAQKVVNRDRTFELPIEISESIKWRTIVVSAKNISKIKLENNIVASNEHKEIFNLYFLSHGDHPNRKNRYGVQIMYDEFEGFLKDLSKDFQDYIGNMTT